MATGEQQVFRVYFVSGFCPWLLQSLDWIIAVFPEKEPGYESKATRTNLHKQAKVKGTPSASRELSRLHQPTHHRSRNTRIHTGTGEVAEVVIKETISYSSSHLSRVMHTEAFASFSLSSLAFFVQNLVSIDIPNCLCISIYLELFCSPVTTVRVPDNRKNAQ